MSALMGVAASGLQAQQLRMDLIANNIANVNTPGFKASRAELRDNSYEVRTVSVGSSAANIEVIGEVVVGTGVSGTTRRLFGQGALQSTEVATDLAVVGEGFFQVRLTDGSTAYTSDGVFAADHEGALVNGDGYRLEPAIQLPAGAYDLSIDSLGTVTAKVGAQGTLTTLGTIELAQFQNPAGLAAEGHGLFTATEVSGAARAGAPGQDGAGAIASGSREQSNVDLASELTDLITAQRAYSMMLKVVQSIDEMTAEAIAMVRA